MDVAAVLFDLDGTLLDTLEDIADASNRVLSRHDYPLHPVSAYRYFVGEGARVLVRRTLPEEARGDDIVNRLYEAFREEYRRNWNAKTRPYEGVPEMLEGLIARGVKIAVLSNKPDDFTRKCVEELLAGFDFDAVLGEREDVPAKPDPRGALRISSDIGVPPERMALVGDTSIDMRTATAAGMLPVGVAWGFRERKELEENGARFILERPRDLLKRMFPRGE